MVKCTFRYKRGQGGQLPKAQDAEKNITYLPDMGGYRVPVDLETGNIKGGILPEVKVSGKATPLVRHKKAYETNNPYDAQQYATDLFNNPKSREEYFDRFNKDKFFQKYGQRGYDEFQDNAWKYAAEQRMSQLPQGNRSRVEYLNDLTAKEEELFKKYNPALQTTYSADFLRAINAKDGESYEQLKDKLYGTENNLYTEREKQKMLQNYKYIGGTHGGDALAPLTWMSKPIQSIYRDNYSPYDALVGRKNDATIVEDIFTDPTLIYGLGKSAFNLGAQGLKQIGKQFVNNYSKSFALNLDDVGRQAFKPGLSSNQTLSSSKVISSIDNIPETQKLWRIQSKDFKEMTPNEVISSEIKEVKKRIKRDRLNKLLSYFNLDKQKLSPNQYNRMIEMDKKILKDLPNNPTNKYYGQWFLNDKNVLKQYYDLSKTHGGYSRFKNPEILEIEIPKNKLNNYNVGTLAKNDELLGYVSENHLNEYIIPQKYKNSAKKYFDADDFFKPVDNVGSGFKSEINWGKWNKEIPGNKALMQEYNAIEQASKADGTWMKNPDGSFFEGTPEQFVQQNSSNFKKAFNNSLTFDETNKIQHFYHGSPKNDITIFKSPSQIENFKPGRTATTSKTEHIYLSPRKGIAEKYSKRGILGNDKGKVYELYANIKNPYITKNYGDLARTEQIPNVKNYDAVTNLNLGKNDMEGFHEIAIPHWNYLKSAIGNNGMFDMTNPNIYKSIAPLVGAGVLGSQYFSNPQEQVEYRNGGLLPKYQDNIKTTPEKADSEVYRLYLSGKHLKQGYPWAAQQGTGRAYPDAREVSPEFEYQGDKHWNVKRFAYAPFFGRTENDGYHYNNIGIYTDENYQGPTTVPLQVGKNKKEQRKLLTEDMTKYYLGSGYSEEEASNKAKTFVKDEVMPLVNSKYHKMSKNHLIKRVDQFDAPSIYSQMLITPGEKRMGNYFYDKETLKRLNEGYFKSGRKIKRLDKDFNMTFRGKSKKEAEAEAKTNYKNFKDKKYTISDFKKDKKERSSQNTLSDGGESFFQEYQNGGGLPKYQNGIPTTADSLALYNNAILKGKFYQNNPDYKEITPTTDNSNIAYIFDEVVNNADMYNKSASDFYANTANRSTYNTIYGSPEERFKVINPNMVQLGDILSGLPNSWYNNSAPPILLHNIIEPKRWIRYDSPDDRTDIPYYDPVEIYPKSLGEVPKEAYRYSDIRARHPLPYVKSAPSASTSKSVKAAPSASVTPSVNYNTDLVAYLQKVGKPFDYNTRKDLAKQYGIDNYKGTAAQNIELLNLIKKGPLPVREKEELGTLPQRETNSKVILNPFEKEGTYSRSRQPQEKGSTMYDKYGKQYQLIDYFTKDGNKKIGTYDPVKNKIVEEYQSGGALPKYQDNLPTDKYGSPVTARTIYDNNVGRTYYDPRTNTMVLGKDYNEMSPEEKKNVMAHENFHAYQFDNDMSTYVPVGEAPIKKPSMVSTDENYYKYHNRKPTEAAIDVDNFIRANSDFRFVPRDLIFDKEIDSKNKQYNNPYSLEGQASYYENTGEIFPFSFRNGGSLPMYQDGDIKVPERKGVRKNSDGSESTHLMATETFDGDNWFSFPTLFQNEDGTWVDMSDRPWQEAYEEAKRRGEVIDFGKDKEAAIKFGEGSWKLPNYQEGGIPERYKNMGFNKVGAKKKSTRSGKKWMVLAKKGDKYKVVHGGDSNMKDFSQHGSKDRKEKFWSRMGGRNSAKAKDPFSPLYWHKRFGTWQEGGDIQQQGYKDTSPYRDNPYIDIYANPYTDSVNITTYGMSMDLKATPYYPNGEVGEPTILAGNSGNYNFEGASWVREEPIEGLRISKKGSKKVLDFTGSRLQDGPINLPQDLMVSPQDNTQYTATSRMEQGNPLVYRELKPERETSERDNPYIKNNSNQVETYNYKGCVKGMCEDMSRSLGKGTESFRKMNNLYGDAWQIVDNMFGEDVSLENNYKNLKVNDVVNLTRESFESDKERGIPSADQHIGRVSKIENGVPYIKHYVGDRYYEEPINNISAAYKYTPTKAKRLDQLKEIDFSPSGFKLDKNYSPLPVESEVVQAITKQKEAIQKSLALTSDEYEQLSKIAYGIIGTESNFGGSERTLYRMIAPDFLQKAIKNVTDDDYNPYTNSISKGYGSLKESTIYNIEDNRDIKDLQRKIGLTGDDVDGMWGPISAAALENYNKTADEKITFDSYANKIQKGNYSDLGRQSNFIYHALADLGVDANNLNNGEDSFKATMAALSWYKKRNPNATEEDFLKFYTGAKDISQYKSKYNNYKNNINDNPNDNLERGIVDKLYGQVSFLANKKGELDDKVVSTITSFVRDAIPAPINIKALIGDMVGAKGTITESTLDDKTLNALKEIVTDKVRKGEFTIGYADYGTSKNANDDVGGVVTASGSDSQESKLKRVLDQIKKGVSDPNYMLKTFLGQARIVDLGNGEYLVEDTYDFNDKGESFGVIDDVKKRGAAPYSLIRALGRNYGSQDGLGAKVKIKITK